MRSSIAFTRTTVQQNKGNAMHNRIQVMIMGLLSSLLLQGCQTTAQPQLTDVAVFTTDSSGHYGGYDIWDTRPTNSAPDTYIIFIQAGGSGCLFLTGPSAANSRPNISLSPGSNSFRLFSEPGFNTPYYGINLFFNGSTTPSISAYAPELMTAGPHTFYANSASNTPPSGPFGTPGPTHFVPGAGTLAFDYCGERITLTDFYWAQPSVYNTDQVGPWSTGPNGVNDFVGGITLSVAQVLGARLPHKAKARTAR